MDDESKLKAAFAALYIYEEQTSRGAFIAASKLFPGEKNIGRCCEVSFVWPADPIVTMELEKLKKDKPNDKIPSKEEAIELMWTLAKNDKVPAKDRAATVRLIAEMLGYIKKDEGDDGRARMPMHPLYKIVQE